MAAKKINIIVFGGTTRSIPTLKSILNRDDINILYCIFMNGSGEEKIAINALETISKQYKVDYIISDLITKKISDKVKNLNADALIGIGVWRSILPDDFIASTRLGALCLHGSPLPLYRGFAGINWQIINGDTSIILRAFRLGNGIDNGDLIVDGKGNYIQYEIDLVNEKHLSEIFHEYERLHINGINLILDMIKEKNISFKKQNESLATFACHRGPDDGEINWNKSTKYLFNFIRGQSKPYSGAFTYFKGKKIKIWRTKPRYEFSKYVGRISGKIVKRDLIKKTVCILTSDSALEIIECGYDNTDISSPIHIFDSVRERCKLRLEAYLDNINF